MREAYEAACEHLDPKGEPFEREDRTALERLRRAAYRSAFRETHLALARGRRGEKMIRFEIPLESADLLEGVLRALRSRI